MASVTEPLCYHRPTRMLAGRLATTFCIALTVITAVSCGHKNRKGNFPDGFAQWSDSKKVEYLMANAAPDSVARFICMASMGEIEGVKIDTLATATLYAYEKYTDADLQTFSQAYDDFASHLSPARKMKLMKLAAEKDGMKLGIDLGLEYVNMIRTDGRNAAQVEEEIAELKKACANDTATFTRFMKGFKVALDADGGNGVPTAIYNKYK